MKVSKTLIVNTLCCAIGPLLAWNISWLWAYRFTLSQLMKDILTCVEVIR